MQKNYFLMFAAILFCGMGLLTSCSANDDNPTNPTTYEDLFEEEMTAALADAWFLWTLLAPDQRLRLLGRHCQPEV